MTTQIRKTPSRALAVLSENLNSIKEKNDWTQGQLGQHLGMSQKNVGRILNQEHEPTLATVSGIADKLKKPEALLLCKGMSADTLLIKSTISEPLRALIDRLISLDSAGLLSDQALATMNHVLAMAAPEQAVTQKSDKTRNVGAY